MIIKEKTYKEFKNKFLELGSKYGVKKVFKDFLNITKNNLNLKNDCERLEEYVDSNKIILEFYKNEEEKQFAAMYADLVNLMKIEPDDYLGRLAKEMGALNSKAGQVYTPIHIAELMAEMNNISKKEDGGEERVYDATCGSGVMFIGHHRAYIKRNPNNDSSYKGVDISEEAVLMTFIQMSILKLKASIIHGNSLTGEVYKEYHTFTGEEILHK